MIRLVAAILLASCATVRSRPIAPDTYEVTCTRSIGDCHERAAKLCSNRYTVVGADQRTGYYVQGSGNTATAIPITRREIVVRCDQVQHPSSP